MDLKPIDMNTKLQMFLYNKLRATNPKLAKTKVGRSLIMKEAVNTINLASLLVYQIIFISFYILKSYVENSKSTCNYLRRTSRQRVER